MEEQRLEIVTASELVPAGSLVLERLRGVEELSRPYEYELELRVEEDGGLSVDVLEDLLRQPCMVRFGRDGTTEVHGLLRSIAMRSTHTPTPIRYRAALVPRVWLASQVRRSRIFQELGVPGIVQVLLEELGLEEDQHFELRLNGSYPEREYTVQYQESDLDFLHRLLEHEGIS